MANKRRQAAARAHEAGAGARSASSSWAPEGSSSSSAASGGFSSSAESSSPSFSESSASSFSSSESSSESSAMSSSGELSSSSCSCSSSSSSWSSSSWCGGGCDGGASLSSSSSELPEEAELCCECGDECDDEAGGATSGPRVRLPGDPSEEACEASADVGGGGDTSFFTVRRGRGARAEQELVERLSLRLRSPWEWRVRLDGELLTVVPPVGAAIYFNAHQESSEAAPAGTSRTRDMRVQLQDADYRACLLRKGPVYALLVDKAGRRLRFELESGEAVSMTTPSGKLVTREQYRRRVEPFFDAQGELLGVYSQVEGLMVSRQESDGTLVMEWYAPDQVRVVHRGARKGQRAGRGEPYRSMRFRTRVDAVGRKTMRIEKRQAGLPEHVILREVEGERVRITRGEGDEAIVKEFVTRRLGEGRVEIVESISRARDAAPAACKRTVKRLSSGGWLLESVTEAYGTPLARTTRYEYEQDAYRPARVLYPDGSVVSYLYDEEGRVIREQRPWGEAGQVQVVTRAYAADLFYDHRLSGLVESYGEAHGGDVAVGGSMWSYEQSAQLLRVEEHRLAVSQPSLMQSLYREFYGEAAPSCAAGKLKRERAANGVETTYAYEESDAYGASWLCCRESRSREGELVAGLSRRSLSYYAADETLRHEQECVWDGAQWRELARVSYEYDEQRRLTRTLRGNGRESRTVWMCCGKLRETDEDGVTTLYAYDSALQLVETTRSAVYEGELCITPEIITEYERDALGRVTKLTRHTGAMSTTQLTAYDALGRVVRQVDALGYETLTTYSEDGLTATVTTPEGATLITQRTPAGRVCRVGGSGQRALRYVQRLEGENFCEETFDDGGDAGSGALLSRVITNGLGEQLRRDTPSLHGLLREVSEYNALGQLVRRYQDAGSGSVPTAPLLYEYDSMGQLIRRTQQLSYEPSPSHSPITEWFYEGVELPRDDEVYSVVRERSYDAAGEPLDSVTKSLISTLSPTLESRQALIDARGHESASWVEFAPGSPRRVARQATPTSCIIAEQVSVDGFTTEQRDSAGVTTCSSRRYTAQGLELRHTDGRGHTTRTLTDLLDRTVMVTDGADQLSLMGYGSSRRQPSMLVNALGEKDFFRYDLRGRKVAEYGATLQPLRFAYDEADHLVALTTYRAPDELICIDPAEAPGLVGDTTRWVYDAATGLLLEKLYANGCGESYAYDPYNRLAQVVNARGITTRYRYDDRRGLLTQVEFSDGTPSIRYEYDFLGRLVLVRDASGTRRIEHDRFGARICEEQAVGGVLFALHELPDSYGRDAGYRLTQDAEQIAASSIGYAENGRIRRVGFRHADEAEKFFSYAYLPGSDLIEKIFMPNGIDLVQEYDAERPLLRCMSYRRHGDTLLARRSYTYDLFNRPTARITEQRDSVTEERFRYNDRSELTAAERGSDRFAYAYDNIGNRTRAEEELAHITYTTNELNQYTRIVTNDSAFTPEFDADGNQTLVQTSSGIWRITYNAQNRAVLFENEAAAISIRCFYDYLGRRFEKRVEQRGQTLLHHRYLYRGYLQIAALDLLRANYPTLWHLLWDPTQALATRPLALRKDATWYTYGWDLTKNVTELFDRDGFLLTSYTYSPFGAVSTVGHISQPIQWSSEFADPETALVYYNFRYYNPLDGRWTRRDPISEKIVHNLYNYGIPNTRGSDYLGMIWNQKQPKSKTNKDFEDEPADNSPCKQALDLALNSPRVQQFIKAKSTCSSLPEIKCACCKGNMAKGKAWYTRGEKASIVVCNNEQQSVPTLANTLVHELTHSYQDCDGKFPDDKDENYCDKMYMNEVEAYSNQGFSCSKALEYGILSLNIIPKCENHTISDTVRQQISENCQNNNYPPLS